MKPVRAVCVVVAAWIISSHPTIKAQQAPVFRSRVEVVQLDVSVLDKKRQPVRGLKEEDFTVFESGKPQKIVGFTSFDIDEDAEPLTGWMRDVPPDVTTNEVKPESRLFVIVIDDALIPQDSFFIKSSKKILAGIVDKLSPHDLTAVVFTGDNRNSQEFTTDKQKLLATIGKFNPGLAGYRFGMETHGLDVDTVFYSSAVKTLNAVAEYLGSIPNRRKAVFWVSPGVPMDLLRNCGAVGRTAGLVPTGRGLGPTTSDVQLMPDGACATSSIPSAYWMNIVDQLDDVFLKAQRANVTMYPIDPGGLDGMQGFLLGQLGPANAGVAKWKSTMQQDFLAMTAANTGGRTLMNINEFETGLRDIFAENSSYYLIGFEPQHPANDGKLRKIEVKVNRPDLEVRTRTGYWATKPEKARTTTAESSPEAAALAKSIGGLLPTPDMPMKVALAPFALAGQRVSTVSIVLGVTEPVPENAARSRTEVATELQISAFTPEGQPRGTQRHTAWVTLRPGSSGDAKYEVLGRIELAPGRYLLRLAAHNVFTRKDGSVFADVVIPDYGKLPVSASPIVLSVTPGRAGAPRDLLASVLPMVPTAERDFTIADRVAALLRLYQNGKKTIERATVSIRIRNAQDRVLIDAVHTIPAEQFVIPALDTPVEKGANLALRSADLQYTIPLAGLGTGPHLLTMEVTMGATVIRRDVRFQVSSGPTGPTGPTGPRPR